MTVPSTPRWSLWHWMPGLFIALAGSAASYALWHQQSSSAEALADVRFAHESHSFAEALQLRLSAHAGMVLGLATSSPSSPTWAAASSSAWRASWT